MSGIHFPHQWSLARGGGGGGGSFYLSPVGSPPKLPVMQSLSASLYLAWSIILILLRLYRPTLSQPAMMYKRPAPRYMIHGIYGPKLPTNTNMMMDIRTFFAPLTTCKGGTPVTFQMASDGVMRLPMTVRICCGTDSRFIDDLRRHYDCDFTFMIPN